jgi:RNase P/RNase MRP subunit POP5
MLYGSSCKAFGIFLVRFHETNGVVRCNHIEKTRTIDLLQSISTIKETSVKVQTFGTSGTIKTLLRKHAPEDCNLGKNKKHYEK